MKKINQILLLSVIIAAFSCTKEKQVPGPAGTNGINGTNGTNYQTSTFFVTIEPWMWTYDSSVQTHYYTWYNSAVKSISFYNIYVDRSGQNQALPYHYYVGSTNVQFDYAPDPYAVNPNIELQYRNYNSPASAPGANIYYEIKIAN